MIRVLIVDDSRVSRELLSHILSSDPGIEVVREVSSGELALAFLSDHDVDVVTMDIEMPGMDGYETAMRIMETRPLPIIVVSAVWEASAAGKTFRALQAGAVAVMAKPVGPTHAAFPAMRDELIATVKAMAGLPVVRRRFRSRTEEPHGKPDVPRPSAAPLAVPLGTPSASPSGASSAAVANARAAGPASPSVESPGNPGPSASLSARKQERREIIVLGASTGGPAAITEILARLPKPFPLPILVVQHIAAGFLAGMAGWLSEAAGMPVRIASEGETPLPGTVYLAPDSLHMTLARDGRIRLVDAAPDAGIRPSVARLFASAAESFGPRAIGVLLTGMGKDGAEELGLMRARGAETIAQDEESSIVFGMPGEAVRRKAARHVLPPAAIAELLSVLAF